MSAENFVQHSLDRIQQHQYMGVQMISRKPELATITLDPRILNQRIQKKPTRLEFMAFSMAFIIIIAFNVPDLFMFEPLDLHDYLRGARGDLSAFYYCYWFLPFLSFLDKLPGALGLSVMSFLGLISVVAAGRIFSGNATLALLSYPLLCCLAVGQFLPIVLGGLALMWWCLAHERWILAGLGLTIAITKPHTGIIFGGLLFLLAGVPWKQCWKVLLIPAVISAISLWIYPGWPIQILQAIKLRPPNAGASVSLWRFWGGYSLLLALPVIMFPLQKRVRILSLCLITPLILPYFQQQDILVLMVLPYGPLLALLNAGIFLPVLNWEWEVITLAIDCTLIFLFVNLLLTELLQQFNKRPEMISLSSRMKALFRILPDSKSKPAHDSGTGDKQPQLSSDGIENVSTNESVTISGR